MRNVQGSTSTRRQKCPFLPKGNYALVCSVIEMERLMDDNEAKTVQAFMENRCEKLNSSGEKMGRYYTHPAWINAKKRGRYSHSLASSILNALKVPEGDWNKYFTRAEKDTAQPTNDESQLLEAYRALQIWKDFPVSQFDDRDLKYAISSELIVEKKLDAGATEGRENVLAVPTLEEVRFPKETLSSIQAVDILKELEVRKSDCAVLLGEAGDGKSTLLRVLANEFFKKNIIPILIRAAHWDDSKQTLSEYLQADNGALNRVLYLNNSLKRKETGALLSNLLDAGKAILLVDGLDEAIDRTWVMKSLLALQAERKGQRLTILVTSRKIGYQRLSGFTEIELRPFGFEKQVIPYVQARLGVDAVPFLKELEDERTRALAGNGLSLGMLCLYWETKRHEMKLPIARDTLYDFAASYLLANPKERYAREHCTFQNASEFKTAILETLGFLAQFCGSGEVNLEGARTFQLPMVSVEDALRWLTKQDDYREYQNTWRSIFECLIRNSELLQGEPRTGPFRFLHPSFQEYYAARFLVRHWEEEGWRDWLPTQQDWQDTEPGHHEARTRCPGKLSHRYLRCFSAYLWRPEYQETLLMMVGMLRGPEREVIFLRGIVVGMPPTRGFDFFYRPLLSLETIEGTEDKEPTLGVNASLLSDEHVDWDAPENLHERWALCDHIQTLLEFALQAIARCHSVYSTNTPAPVLDAAKQLNTEPSITIENILTVLERISWRRNYRLALSSLGRARELGNASAAVAFYIIRLQYLTASLPVREAAARALGVIAVGSAEVINALLVLLKDENFNARKSADEALGAIVNGSAEVINALLVLLKDKDAYVRMATARALGMIAVGSAEVINALLVLLKDKDAAVCMAATKALGMIAVGNEEAINALLVLMRDKNRFVCLDAARALRAVANGDAEVINALTALLKDKDFFVRWTAATALGMVAVGNGEAINALLAKLKDDRFVRMAAARALGMIAVGNEEAINALLVLLKDKDADVCLVAARALGAMAVRNAEVINALTVLLRDSANWPWDTDVELDAAEVLGTVARGNAEAISTLIVLLKDANASVREAAARALAADAAGNAEAINALIVLLKDADSFVRGAAAETFGAVANRNAEVINTLLVLLKDKDPSRIGYVYEVAAKALGMIAVGNEEAINALIVLLKDEDADVRWAMAEALGMIAIGSAEATNALLVLLGDKNHARLGYVRMAAVKALGMIAVGNEEAIKAVMRDIETEAEIRGWCLQVLLFLEEKC